MPAELGPVQSVANPIEDRSRFGEDSRTSITRKSLQEDDWQIGSMKTPYLFSDDAGEISRDSILGRKTHGMAGVFPHDRRQFALVVKNPEDVNRLIPCSVGIRCHHPLALNSSGARNNIATATIDGVFRFPFRVNKSCEHWWTFLNVVYEFARLIEDEGFVPRVGDA
ncbi:MAG: hypothetical protein ABI672_01210 [Vicinamibacteria bacterium]